MVLKICCASRSALLWLMKSRISPRKFSIAEFVAELLLLPVINSVIFFPEHSICPRLKWRVLVKDFLTSDFLCYIGIGLDGGD